VTEAGRQGDAAKQFEQELRDVVARFDPVPERVKSRARSVPRVHAPDGSDLLELVYDSVLDADVVVMSGSTPVRLLSFAGGGARLEIRVDTLDRVFRVTGWLAPVAATAAAVRTEGTLRDLQLHDDGTFVAEDVPRAQVSIAVEAPLHGTNRRFHSSWFAL
jgi:hypothetical protein